MCGAEDGDAMRHCVVRPATRTAIVQMCPCAAPGWPCTGGLRDFVLLTEDDPAPPIFLSRLGWHDVLYQTVSSIRAARREQCPEAALPDLITARLRALHRRHPRLGRAFEVWRVPAADS